MEDAHGADGGFSCWGLDIASPKRRRAMPAKFGAILPRQQSAHRGGRRQKKRRRTPGGLEVIFGAVRGWLHRWARGKCQMHSMRRFVCENIAVNSELYGRLVDSQQHALFLNSAVHAWEMLSAMQKACFVYEPPYRDAKVTWYPWLCGAGASSHTGAREGRVLRVSGHYSQVHFDGAQQEWVCSFHVFLRSPLEASNTMAPHLRWFYMQDCEAGHGRWEPYDERAVQAMRRAFNRMAERGFRGIWAPPLSPGGRNSVFDFVHSTQHVYPAGLVRRIAACDCLDLAVVRCEISECFSSFSHVHRLKGARLTPSSYEQLSRSHLECAVQIGGSDMSPIHVLGFFELRYDDVHAEDDTSLNMMWYGCNGYEWLRIAACGLTSAARRRPRGWQVGATPPEPGVYVYRRFERSMAQCAPMETEMGGVHVHMLCHLSSGRGSPAPERLCVADEDLAIPKYMVVWMRAWERYELCS